VGSNTVRDIFFLCLAVTVEVLEFSSSNQQMLTLVLTLGISFRSTGLSGLDLAFDKINGRKVIFQQQKLFSNRMYMLPWIQSIRGSFLNIKGDSKV
jgi:hypothetical protein